MTAHPTFKPHNCGIVFVHKTDSDVHSATSFNVSLRPTMCRGLIIGSGRFTEFGVEFALSESSGLKPGTLLGNAPSIRPDSTRSESRLQKSGSVQISVAVAAAL